MPLLLCWALALVGFSALFETDELWPALLLGVAFGAGLNAKYAMAWFIICAAIYFVHHAGAAYACCAIGAFILRSASVCC